MSVRVRGSQARAGTATLARCAEPQRTEPKGRRATRVPRPLHPQLVQHTANLEASWCPKE